MIKRQKEVGWEFLFIGANIDAVETAKRYGIGSDRVANYKADSQGTEILYESVAAAVSQVRSHAPLSAKWNKKMEDDLASNVSGRRRRRSGAKCRNGQWFDPA